MEHEGEDPWADDDTLAAIQVAARNGMPPRALAIFARWWQLETWLRELAYVELRAKHGSDWTSVVSRASGRQIQDAAFTHMESADSQNPLAYLDYSQLVELIADNWDLFGYALIERRSWEGRQEELKRIRHRIGHMRTPHADDLGRLEQTLRDLERGAFMALASYNTRYAAGHSRSPVVSGWIKGEHDDAQRLVAHAEQQYETSIVVRASHRPWARGTAIADPAPGILWHAEFFLRGRTVDAAALWRDSWLDSVRGLIVHMLADDPSQISFTFSAADPGGLVADAIGTVFDALLATANPWRQTERDDESWGRRARNADFRVLHGTGWNIVDETTIPITNFGAGGGVERAPDW